MADSILERLKRLHAEYDAGQRMLADLDGRRASLTNTLLRLEGAIQVLEEMIGEGEITGPNGSSPGPGAGLPPG
jgi:predicted nuclease with TOPRIM domain